MNKMKKFKTTKSIILTALMVVGTLFTSCSKDDNNDENSNPSIVGVWRTTAGVNEIFKDGVSQGKTNRVIDAKNYFDITFKADATFSIYDVSEEHGETTDPGTYTIASNELSLVYDGDDTEVFKHLYTLTKNNLVLIDTEVVTEEGVTTKTVNTFTFTRQ